MKLFDALHVTSLFAIAILFFGLFFAFRKSSERTKKIVLGIIMGLNLLQHLLKCWVWPHMWGKSFGLPETAYNVCAFMIFLCPISVYGKSELLKQFQAYVGTCAGIFAPFIPYWFIGKDLLTWDFLRFWTCHTLLFLTSLLPAVWGMVKFRMKDGWKFGLCFLGMLALILLNNAVTFAALGYEGETFTNALFAQNPVWMMGPPAGESFIKTALDAVTLPFFKGGDGGRYTPILWYALPVYLLFLALGYALGAAFEKLQSLKKT